MSLSVRFTNNSRINAGSSELPDKRCRMFYSHFGERFLVSLSFPLFCFTPQIASAVSLIQPESHTITIHYNVCVRAYESVCVCVCTRHSGGSNPSTFTISLRPNLRPVLQQRGLLLASRQFNHTYSTTPFSFPFHIASIPLWLHNSPLRAVEPV